MFNVFFGKVCKFHDEFHYVFLNLRKIEIKLQFWPFFKAVGRRKSILPKQQKLAEFWPNVESPNKQRKLQL